MLAIVALLQLVLTLPTPIKEITIYAIGCCQISVRKIIDQQNTNNEIALMNPLKYFLKDFKNILKCVYLEKIKTFLLIGLSSCANYVLDKIAASQEDFE